NNLLPIGRHINRHPCALVRRETHLARRLQRQRLFFFLVLLVILLLIPRPQRSTIHADALKKDSQRQQKPSAPHHSRNIHRRNHSGSSLPSAAEVIVCRRLLSKP